MKGFLGFTCSRKWVKNRDSSRWKEVVWLAGAATYLVNCWLLATHCWSCSFIFKTSIVFQPQSCVLLKCARVATGPRLHTENNWVATASFSNKLQKVQPSVQSIKIIGEAVRLSTNIWLNSEQNFAWMMMEGMIFKLSDNFAVQKTLCWEVQL